MRRGPGIMRRSRGNAHAVRTDPAFWLSRLQYRPAAQEGKRRWLLATINAWALARDTVGLAGPAFDRAAQHLSSRIVCPVNAGIALDDALAFLLWLAQHAQPLAEHVPAITVSLLCACRPFGPVSTSSAVVEHDASVTLDRRKAVFAQILVRVSSCPPGARLPSSLCSCPKTDASVRCAYCSVRLKAASRRNGFRSLGRSALRSSSAAPAS